MSYSRKLQFVLSCLSLLLVSTAIAQEKGPVMDRNKGGEFQGWPDWNGDRWIQALVDLRVDIDANHVLDRLARFHLSSNQVKQLITAANEEQSDSKRVVLWQAIRMSHDYSGRDYLINTLVGKSSVQMQLQFIEKLRNPSRFDVPILASLYNGRSRRGNENIEADSTVHGYGGKATEPGQTAAEVPNSNGYKSDLFNVPNAIVELTCLTNWKSSVIDRTLTPFREEDYDTEAMNEKRLLLSGKISKEAELAQHAMVHWLIRNGFEDGHRISAFERFVHNSDFQTNRTIVHDYGFDLLKDLTNPTSKAKIVTLVGPSVDPSRFLVVGEADEVRLSAVKAIEKAVIESRKAHSSLIFRDVTLVYKPILEMVQASDPSPDVRHAAKLVQGTIAEYEKLDSKYNSP
jgi:hypothetical protein